ncbi:hypothetical protein N9174_02085 [bacterium]|nr:hypothetical protein [bacterium]
MPANDPFVIPVKPVLDLIVERESMPTPDRKELSPDKIGTGSGGFS